MGKYIAKRLGYMLVVMLILSLLMFLVYSMIPYDRAVAEAESFKQGLKNNPNAAELYNANIENFVTSPFFGPANAILYANIKGY